MINEEYLNEILQSQTLDADVEELKLLRSRRNDVDKLLRNKFGSAPSIRYGGSKAKGTMIKDSYDLDITCYFENEDSTAGETLQEIYESAVKVFENDYYIERKPSAVRLKCKNTNDEIEDYHIDVVPGRFVDDNRDDVFLYRHSAEKGRQKTNLSVHISHVKDSGVVDDLRLMKLWRVRNELIVRNFILELLVIELLEEKKDAELTDRLKHVWTALRDNIDDITIEDPANPTGNDLSELFNSTVKFELSQAAETALTHVGNDDWEAIFGEVPEAAIAEAENSRVNAAPAIRIVTPCAVFGGE